MNISIHGFVDLRGVLDWDFKRLFCQKKSLEDFKRLCRNVL